MAPIKKVSASAYEIPTKSEESDGTIAWSKTILVLVEIEAGDQVGIGYTYADASTCLLIKNSLGKLLIGHEASDIPACWDIMVREVRNLGLSGIASRAISALDVALWDLKARLWDVSLSRLLGRSSASIEVYGSGGFTSYSIAELQKQLAGWAEQGFLAVKMKVGRHPDDDVDRVEMARRAIGDDVQLYVDANGAYGAKQALGFAEAYSELGVTWFEEPVDGDDLDGLRWVRDRAPMRIAAGEYGDRLSYFQKMLSAKSVDVLQADATRCCGITGFLQAAAVCEAHHFPFSSHCAPALHVHAAASVPCFTTAEYFFDQYSIDKIFFEGVPQFKDGRLWPDIERPGLGLTLRRNDVEKFKL